MAAPNGCVGNGNVDGGILLFLWNVVKVPFGITQRVYLLRVNSCIAKGQMLSVKLIVLRTLLISAVAMGIASAASLFEFDFETSLFVPNPNFVVNDAQIGIHGRGNQLSLVGGIRGNAANFTDNSFIMVSDAGNFTYHYLDTITSVSFWFKTESHSRQFISFSKSNTQAFWVLLTPEGNLEYAFADLTGSNKVISQQSQTSNLNDNIWHHCHFQKAGSQSLLFIDGTIATTQSYRSIDPSYLSNSTQIFQIGGLHRGKTQEFPFEGQLDLMAFSNTASTPGEISNKYKTTRNSPPVFLSSANLYGYENENGSAVLLWEDDQSDQISTSILSAPDGISLNGNTLSWNTRYLKPGKYPIWVRGKDQNQSYRDDSLSLLIQNINDPPIVAPQYLPTLASAGMPFSYVLPVTDPDPSDELTFKILQAPACFQIVGKTLTCASVPFTPYKIQLSLQVSDSKSPPVPINISMSLIEDILKPRVLTKNLAKAAAGQQLTFSLQAESQSGATFFWEMLSGPSNAQFNQHTGVLVYSIPRSTKNSIPFKFKVSDGTTCDSIELTQPIAEINSAPRILDFSPVATYFTGMSNTLPLPIIDDERDSISIKVKGINTGALNTLANQLVWTPPQSSPEFNDTLYITVSDGKDTSTYKQVYFLKATIPLPPVTQPTPSASKLAGQTVGISRYPQGVEILLVGYNDSRIFVQAFTPDGKLIDKANLGVAQGIANWNTHLLSDHQPILLMINGQNWSLKKVLAPSF